MCLPPKYLSTSDQRTLKSGCQWTGFRGGATALDRHSKLNLISEVSVFWGKLFFFLSFGLFVLFRQTIATVWNTHGSSHRHTPVWVGGAATQQLSDAAYGASNWVEQHSWRTPVQDLAPGNQSLHPQPSTDALRRCIQGGACGNSKVSSREQQQQKYHRWPFQNAWIS